ncbi:hypothetical protein [Streptomyces sp. NPDC059176]|uniref:hypothetical protein n=1 Tax=Streptomyces sp. NPDC059176 TaxID=3346758 RepID=UPI0036998D73
MSETPDNRPSSQPDDRPNYWQKTPGDCTNAGTKPYTKPRSDQHPNLWRRPRVKAS